MIKKRRRLSNQSASVFHGTDKDIHIQKKRMSSNAVPVLAAGCQPCGMPPVSVSETNSKTILSVYSYAWAPVFSATDNAQARNSMWNTKI